MRNAVKLFMTEIPIIQRNQSIDLCCKSMDRFLYDKDPRHERVKDSICDSLARSFWSQRRTQSPVKHLRWSVSRK